MNKIKKNLKKYLLKDQNSELVTEKFLRKYHFISTNETHINDIFIAGYPKSGNTWMQNLLAGIQFGIETSLLPDKLTQELVPDLHSKPFYKRFDDVVFFKSHDLPKERMRKVIHLIRDGRDVMASYYAMNKAMNKDVTLEDMIVLGKGVYPSKWHEHTKQWVENPFNAEIIVVKYEDLLEDPFREMKKIIEFSGLERSDDVIKRAIKGNSFNEMKRKGESYGYGNSNWDMKNDFIRKGKIGSYKKELSSDLIKKFEGESKNELMHFNYLR